jgi:hypothetical protein
LARALVVVANGEDKGAPDSLYLFPSIFGPRPVVDEVAENLFKLGKNLSVEPLGLELLLQQKTPELRGTGIPAEGR